MKKSLLLIIALLVISVSAYAAAPQFPDLPDLKLVLNTGLTPAFDIECFNTGDKATSYSVVSFASLGSMSSSWYLQGGFASATVGTNTFTATNEGGPGNQTNKTKWSTYRIEKLPIVGLNVGQSITINVGSKVSPANPPSFGVANALISSDTTKVTAVWADANNVTISMIAAASGPVYVSVIASPSATPTVGYDQDKEQIAVYPNLYQNNTFTTAADTVNWGVEVAGGSYPNKMVVGWATSVADPAGTVGNGVMTLTAPDATYGYKGTNIANAVPYAAGQWYISRMKYFTSGSVAAAQAQIWNFSNIVNGALHTDLMANIIFGSATTWTWFEAPMYSNQSGSGYAQIYFKPSGGGLTANIDEVQIINAKPALIDARGCTKLGYAYGDFDAANDSTGWGREAYNTNVVTKSLFTIAGGKLSFTITAGTANGAKWTANNGGSGIYTPASPAIGKGVGLKADVNVQSGALTDGAGIWVNYVYGVKTDGAALFTDGGQILGAAEFVGVTNGTHYVVGAANNGFNQFQFALKGDQAATVVVDNVDFISDNDGFVFGDKNLFP